MKEKKAIYADVEMLCDCGEVISSRWKKFGKLWGIPTDEPWMKRHGMHLLTGKYRNKGETRWHGKSFRPKEVMK